MEVKYIKKRWLVKVLVIVSVIGRVMASEPEDQLKQHDIEAKTQKNIWLGRVDELPTDCIEAIGQFLRELDSPCPALQASKCNYKALGRYEVLIGVTDEGKLIFKQRGRSGSFAIGQNNIGSIIYNLPDKWTLAMPSEHWRDFPCIPVMRQSDGLYEYACLTCNDYKIGPVICRLKKPMRGVIGINKSTMLLKLSMKKHRIVTADKVGDITSKIPMKRMGASNIILDPSCALVLYSSYDQQTLLGKILDDECFTIPVPYKCGYIHPESVKKTGQNLHVTVQARRDYNTAHEKWISLYFVYNMDLRKSVTIGECPLSAGMIKTNEKNGLMIGSSPVSTMMLGDSILSPHVYSFFSNTSARDIATLFRKNERDCVPDIESSGILSSENGRFHAAHVAGGSIYQWQLTGVNLKPACTYLDRYALLAFNQLYQTAKNNRWQCHLTTEQWELYKKLFNKSECELPHYLWKWRFSKPYDTYDKQKGRMPCKDKNGNPLLNANGSYKGVPLHRLDSEDLGALGV